MKDIRFRRWDSKHQTFDTNPIIDLLVCKINAVDLMQFTGFDNIYEGDIIGESRVNQEDEVLGIVKYDEDVTAFVIEITNGGFEYLARYMLENRMAKVIGNIYENNELKWK